MINLSCDFETSTGEWLEIDDRARVWLWDIYDITTGEHTTGTELDEFMKIILKSRNNRQSRHVYFHNLKYDGTYIVDWLLRHGWEYSDEKREGCFRPLITKLGVWYNISVWLKGDQKVEFRDSYKKIPLSVKQMAKSYGLDIRKGEIDYVKYRPPGYEPSEDEIAYVRNDTEIVGKVLKILFGMGFDRLTNASDSWNDFKSKYTKKQYEYLFPVLKLEYDNDIRRAYKGGFTYLDKRFRRKDVRRNASVRHQLHVSLGDVHARVAVRKAKNNAWSARTQPGAYLYTAFQHPISLEAWFSAYATDKAQLPFLWYGIY